MQSINYFSQNKILQHSLATPVTNILLNAQLASKLESGLKIKQNYFHHLDQILLSAKYMESVLKLSDDGDMEKMTFSPKSALLEILILAKKPNLSNKIISHLNIEKDLIIKGNLLYFQEAIICLLNNALESYKNAQQFNNVLLIASVKDGCLEISICDGGKGMNLLERSTVLLLKKSLKGKNRGNGICFAKKIITSEFFGKFNICSKKGKGTTVKISIPI